MLLMSYNFSYLRRFEFVFVETDTSDNRKDTDKAEQSISGMKSTNLTNDKQL